MEREFVVLKLLDRVLWHVVAMTLAGFPNVRFEGVVEEPGSEFVNVWLHFPNEFVERQFHDAYANVLYREARKVV